MTRFLSLMMFAALLMSVSVLAGCGDEPDTRTEDGKLKVATSIIPHGWLLKKIGGEHVDVAVAVPAGSGPHNYQPSDIEMSRLASSALYFRCGVPMENGSWFKGMEEKDWLTVVDLRDGITLIDMVAHHYDDEEGHDDHKEHGHDEHKDHDHEGRDHDDHGSEEHHEHKKHDDHDHHDHHDHGGKDPHTWTSIPNLIHQAETITKALSKADPDHAADYQANLEALKKELEPLDAEFKALFKDHQGDSFMIYHPAWGYFAKDYGLNQIPIELEGKSPSDQEMTQLVKLAKEKKIRVIFIQNSIKHESAERIAQAIGAEVVEVDPLAEDVPGNLKRVADAFKKAIK